mgnify:CR=1 FL=1
MFKGKVTRDNNRNTIKQHIDKVIQHKMHLAEERRDIRVKEIVDTIFAKLDSNEMDINYEKATIWVELDGDSGIHYFYIAAKLLDKQIELMQWRLAPHTTRFLLRPLTNQVQIDRAIENINNEALRYDLKIYKNPEGYEINTYKGDE